MKAEERAAEEMHFEWARAWLRQILADRKQAQSESTARSLASQFRRAEQDGANEALERAAQAIEAHADPGNIVGFMQVEHARRIRSLKSTGGGK